MSKNTGNITFTISEAARQIGVVPATIRNWEKSGLIVAKRSPANYRVFTMDDIELLKKIREYSVDKHMGAHAIKMLIPVSSDSDVEQYVKEQKESYYSQKFLSGKWREIRNQQGYTLEEVSRAVGISTATLSKLENGGSISLNVLNKLAHFYHENPLYFMEAPAQESLLVKKGKGEPIQLKNDPGLEMASLVSLREHFMYPVLCDIAPGCGNLAPHTHNGEEFIYLLSGIVEIRINDDPPYLMHPGDSFYYRGSDLHSWQNVSNKPARMLWVHCSLSAR